MFIKRALFVFIGCCAAGQMCAMDNVGEKHDDFGFYESFLLPEYSENELQDFYDTQLPSESDSVIDNHKESSQVKKNNDTRCSIGNKGNQVIHEKRKVLKKIQKTLRENKVGKSKENFGDKFGGTGVPSVNNECFLKELERASQDVFVRIEKGEYTANGIQEIQSEPLFMELKENYRVKGLFKSDEELNQATFVIYTALKGLKKTHLEKVQKKFTEAINECNENSECFKNIKERCAKNKELLEKNGMFNLIMGKINEHEAVINKDKEMLQKFKSTIF